MLRKGSEVFSRETMNCGIEILPFSPQKNRGAIAGRRFPRLFGDLRVMARGNGGWGRIQNSEFRRYGSRGTICAVSWKQPGHLTLAQYGMRFRALDRKRIQFARVEVLARYLERRPNGETGEMGIVRSEIGKKRRHLPIRKLMEQAGSAVQKLKPVFLMSPLSVARFLQPGRMTFDLVVIDEATRG